MKKKRFENIETSHPDFTTSTQKSIAQRVRNWRRRIELPPDQNEQLPEATPAPQSIDDKPDVTKTDVEPVTQAPAKESNTNAGQTTQFTTSTTKRGFRSLGRHKDLPEQVPQDKMIEYAKKMPQLVHHLRRYEDNRKLHAAEMRVLRSVIGVALGLGLILISAPQIMTLRTLGFFLVSSVVWYLIRKFLR